MRGFFCIDLCKYSKAYLSPTFKLNSKTADMQRSWAVALKNKFFKILKY